MPTTYRVGDYCIGGVLGECPTWLIPTILYHGDKLLLSPKGEFDKKTLADKIQEALTIVSEYKLVLALDVVIPSVDSAQKILSFIGDYKIPILIESPDPQVRAHSYKIASEIGIVDYVIANGIYVDTTDEELRALRESNLKKAVLIVFDPRNPYESLSDEKRSKMLEELLIPIAKLAGVELMLLDFVVLDPGSIAICGEAIRKFKSKYESPAGCAPANALGNVSKNMVSIDELYGVHGGSAAYLRMKGADFIMIGPLSRLKYVAPVISMIDGLLGYEVRRSGRKLIEQHPIKGLLRKVQRLFTQPVLPGI